MKMMGSFFPDGAELYTKWTGSIGDAGARLKKKLYRRGKYSRIDARLPTQTVYLSSDVERRQICFTIPWLHSPNLDKL